MTTRRNVLEALVRAPRTASSLARELGIRRADIQHELEHALRSAEAAGYHVRVEPARCRTCGFEFDRDRLTKPGKCPKCRQSRIVEPLIVLSS
ncbi:MAG: transcriptional regulator [Acidobacteria bacterium]|nr:transcriptional regulator [Acidobacteriota bacterium]